MHYVNPRFTYLLTYLLAQRMDAVSLAVLYFTYASVFLCVCHGWLLKTHT